MRHSIYGKWVDNLKKRNWWWFWLRKAKCITPLLAFFSLSNYLRSWPRCWRAEGWESWYYSCSWYDCDPANSYSLHILCCLYNEKDMRRGCIVVTVINDGVVGMFFHFEMAFFGCVFGGFIYFVLLGNSIGRMYDVSAC